MVQEDNSATRGCAVGERTVPLPGMGDHAPKSFYGPDEEAPLADFGHSVGDGYIALLYPATLGGEDLAELRSYVNSMEGDGLLAGAADQAGDRFVAITFDQQLTCEELDIAALAAFKDDWFDSL